MMWLVIAYFVIGGIMAEICLWRSQHKQGPDVIAISYVYIWVFWALFLMISIYVIFTRKKKK